ncbi:conjugal transfer protein [Salmonella enterica]|nr:conjugal transfer protein [Salmonella enterica]
MKYTVITAMLFCLFVSPAFAEKNNVDPNDPCDVFFCMAGKVYGENSSECRPAIKKFFSINAFKKHHIFNPSKTFRKRNEFLGQCPSADPSHVHKIMGKFGRIKG